MRICLARTASWRLECPELAHYISRITDICGKRQDITLDLFTASNARIAMCRNMAVAHARKTGADILWFIDPDMVIDRYVRRDPYGNCIGKARPFFDQALAFLQKHMENVGPCVVAAPYVGPLPDQPLHVFSRNQKNELVRVPKDVFKEVRDWTAVEAIGTGCMMIPMQCFDLLEKTVVGKTRLAPPFFEDEYTDAQQTKLRFSQDVRFCLKLRQAGVPIYCAWHCPAGHYQNCIMEVPGWPAETLRQSEKTQQPGVLVIHGEGDTCWN